MNVFSRDSSCSQDSDIAARLGRAYEQWFADVTAQRDYRVPSRIRLGSEHENPVVLTRQDWRGPEAGWGPMSRGYWQVEVREAGRYLVTLHFAASPENRRARLKIGEVSVEVNAPADATELTFEELRLHAGPSRLARRPAFGRRGNLASHCPR